MSKEPPGENVNEIIEKAVVRSVKVSEAPTLSQACMEA